MESICPYTSLTEAGLRMSRMPSHEIPSIAEAFGGNYRLIKAFHAAGFKSVVPIMLMPREALVEIDGIGTTSAQRVTKTLKAYGLGHHVVCERMASFIEKEFGSVEDAPVSVLQVTIVRGEQLNRPMFAPLEVVSLLEDIESHMTVGDLARMTREDVRRTVQGEAVFGLEIHDLREDMKHLAMRLGNFDLEFGMQMPTPLRVVNEK